MRVEFILNGRKTVLDTDGSRRLVDTLRGDLGLTGTKEGCGEGECGACTVILDGKAVHSCLVMTGQVDGREVTTIEGLAANGELDPIQRMFVKNNAIQCGFCTPGMIMAAKALLTENPDPSDEEIREAIAGNICRCSGYGEITAAISEAAALLRGETVSTLSGGEETRRPGQGYNSPARPWKSGCAAPDGGGAQ